MQTLWNEVIALSIVCVNQREKKKRVRVFTSTHLCEIWDTVSIPHLHCMYCYCFLLWIQHIPLEADWMGLRKATSSLWDPCRHRKHILCVSCPLIKNTEGIKNDFLRGVACTDKSVLCQSFALRRLSRWCVRYFHSKPGFMGELFLLQLSTECHRWFDHHYFCHDFMASAWFIIFCEVSVVKGQWWRFLTRKWTLYGERARNTPHLHNCTHVDWGDGLTC